MQQWWGSTSSSTTLKKSSPAAGFPVSDILFNIVITGAVNVLFTIIALRTVDRYGRRVLMLVGSAGLGIIYALLGLLYYLHGRGIVMLFLVVAAIACFAMFLAPVTWVVISEIFPSRIRVQRFPLPSPLYERLLCAHLYLSFFKPRIGRIGNVLDIRRHLLSRFRLPALPSAGNQGKVAGSNRAVVELNPASRETAMVNGPLLRRCTSAKVAPLPASRLSCLHGGELRLRRVDPCQADIG